MGVSWVYLGLASALSLACATLGFRRFVYFFTLSYALSIGTQAVVFATVFSNTIAGWPLAQSALLLIYALRLGGFLVSRARGAGYQQALKHALATGLNVATAAKAATWLGVSILYVLLVLPALLTLAAQARGASTGSAPAGVAIMAIGLLLEATADRQKSQFKLQHADRFCNVGLYRMVRCPNYLGEIIFWFGAWFAGIAAYETGLPGMLSTLGFLCMVGVMLGATRRLESAQSERYGTDSEYRHYVTTVPVLLPLIPLYSLRPATPRAP